MNEKLYGMGIFNAKYAQRDGMTVINALAF